MHENPYPTSYLAKYSNNCKFYQLKKECQVEICNNEQNSPLCIELKSAIVEICTLDKKGQNAPLCSDKVHFSSLAELL